MTTHRSISHRDRRAFTLLEMLLVLAIMVLMAGLAWPALRSSMAKSRLRDSAQQLRVELARARLTAMEHGVPWEFRYRAGESRFRIAAKPSDEAMDGARSGAGRHAAGRRVATRASGSGGTGSSRGGQPSQDEFTEAELPDGVVFAPPQTQPLATDPLADDLSGEPLDDDALEAAGWSSAIVFLPDGTASNATLALRNGEGSQVTVQLRGITGLAKPGDIESCDETDGSLEASAEPPLKTAREDDAPLVR